MRINVILVNYDDAALKLYVPLLAGNGVTARAVTTMQDALVMLVEGEYSGVVINGDCFDYKPLLKVMRKLTNIPLCVSLSSYDPEENDAAIIAGADIYRARYNAAKKRVERFSDLVKLYVEFVSNQQQPITVITHGELQVYPFTRKVRVQGTETPLLPKEFDILHYLITNRGIVLSYTQIIRRIWGDDYADSSRDLLWAHVSRLRRKLRTDPDLPDFIVTERNYGYVFNPGEKTG